VAVLEVIWTIDNGGRLYGRLELAFLPPQPIHHFELHASFGYTWCDLVIVYPWTVGGGHPTLSSVTR